MILVQCKHTPERIPHVLGRNWIMFAELKSTLRSQGLLIDDFDLLIGASAVANDLILVTENVKHLERIPHLKIENWIDRAKI